MLFLAAAAPPFSAAVIMAELAACYWCCCFDDVRYDYICDDGVPATIKYDDRYCYSFAKAGIIITWFGFFYKF